MNVPARRPARPWTLRVRTTADSHPDPANDNVAAAAKPDYAVLFDRGCGKVSARPAIKAWWLP